MSSLPASPSMVSEPGLGAIRLQWWREAIDRAAKGEATGHPVADAIGAAMRQRKLSRARIDALIDARSFDVETKIMPDWAALEAYLAATAGGLFALGGECLGSRGPSLETAAIPGRARLWPDRADAGLAGACRERPRLSPGRRAPSPRHIARSGACREVERRPSRRAGRAARQGEASLAEASRMSPSSMPMRAPPSGRFAWLTLISLRWRKPSAIRCARSPGSIRSPGFGAWRAGADSERRRRCTSARSNPGGSAGFPTSAPPPRAFRSPSPSPRR